MWFGHVSMSSDLSKTILQGLVKGKKEEETDRRGGKTILDNGRKWNLPA